MRIAAMIAVVLPTGLLIVRFLSVRVPSRVDQYLTYCPDHIAACENEVALVNIALMLAYMPGIQPATC